MLYLFDTQNTFKNEEEFKEYVDGLYKDYLKEEPNTTFKEYYNYFFLDPTNFIYDSNTGKVVVADDYYRQLYCCKNT